MQFFTWILIDTLFFLDSTRFDIERIYHPQALDAGNLLFCHLAFFSSQVRRREEEEERCQLSSLAAEWLNCGGTREVRSDVGIYRRTLAATSVHVMITPRPPRPMTTQIS